MIKLTIISILLVLSSIMLSAQHESKLPFSNELKGKDAHFKIKQTNAKGSDNKLNLLFTYWTDSTNKSFDIALDILQSDSFYYVYGCQANRKLPHITKFDLNGNKIWHRKDSVFLHQSINYWDDDNTIIKLSNNNFLNVFNYIIIDTSKLFNPFLPAFVSFDKDNNIKYIYSNWPDSIQFAAMGIVPDKDAGFTSVGGLSSQTLQWVAPNNGSSGYYIPDTMYLGIVSFDSNLNITRKAKAFVQFPNCNNETLLVEDLEKAHDGGYIVGGHIGVCGGVNGWSASTAFVIKFDSLLNKSWSLYFEDSIGKDSSPFNIVPSRDGSYIYTREHTKTQSIAYGKFDENGNILWEKYFRKTLDTNGLGGVLTIWDRPYGVIEKENGDIIFGSRINGSTATGLVRTDSVGNVKWSRVISTLYQDSLLYYSYIFNLKNPIGEGALLVGRVNTMGAFLIRTDSLGCTLPNCLDTTLHVSIEEIVELKEQKIIVYPNPTQHTIQVAINEQGEKIEQITIYDTNGREIFNESVDTYIFTKDIRNLSNGVYIIKVKGNKGSILSKKFVKQ